MENLYSKDRFQRRRMNNLYSKGRLRRLRNDIPIATVIGDILAIPSKISEGYFRFLCPKCKEFNTATNPKTNLGRCFRCEINYNSIDIVMAVKNYNFKEAVKFLDTLRKIQPQVLLKVSINRGSIFDRSKPLLYDNYFVYNMLVNKQIGKVYMNRKKVRSVRVKRFFRWT